MPQFYQLYIYIELMIGIAITEDSSAMQKVVSFNIFLILFMYKGELMFVISIMRDVNIVLLIVILPCQHFKCVLARN